MKNKNVVIYPTVTASDPHEYRDQMERIAPFSKHVHIDLADGIFTKQLLVGLEHVWWPAGMTADIHMMYESVDPYIDMLVKLRPHRVILQAESYGNFYQLSRYLNKFGIRIGLALLQNTEVKTIKKALKDIPHVLIFSGNLGHFGGEVDLKLLDKVKQIQKIRSDIEFGWDGGINEENISQLVNGGISVLNVGGTIQRAHDPEAVYKRLTQSISML